jgi:hypothetical protein
MNSLGELSEGGMGVPQSYQTAESWYMGNLVRCSKPDGVGPSSAR